MRLHKGGGEELKSSAPLAALVPLEQLAPATRHLRYRRKDRVEQVMYRASGTSGATRATARQQERVEHAMSTLNLLTR